VRMSKDTNFLWEIVGTSEEQEAQAKKQQYEKDPIVRSVKAFLGKSSIGEWRGTATDFMMQSCDALGGLFVEANASRLGKQIDAVRVQLYNYDNVCHEKLRGRVHRFYVKKPHWTDNYVQNQFET